MSDYTKEDLERDYYLGSYQTCINKATSMEVSRESIYYMCLSYCHTKKWDNLMRELDKAKTCDLEEDEGDDRTFIDVIHLFREQLTKDKDNTDCVKALDLMISKKVIKANDELSRLLANAIYARNREYMKALEVIDRFDSLRSLHAKVTTLIMIERQDLAEKEVAKMEKIDEQAAITELSAALVRLANRNPNPAWRLALSLSERYRPTPLLSNLQAAAAICLGDYEAAKELCESSLDMDNDNLEALINMIHILYKTRASASIIERNVQRLRDLYPDDKFVKELDAIPAEMAA